MVLVVRNDLKMGIRKAAAQCSYATLGIEDKIYSKLRKLLIKSN
jgi:peptidyl-tRNA hydrolase